MPMWQEMSLKTPELLSAFRGRGLGTRLEWSIAKGMQIVEQKCRGLRMMVQVCQFKNLFFPSGSNVCVNRMLCRKLEYMYREVEVLTWPATKDGWKCKPEIYNQQLTLNKNLWLWIAGLLLVVLNSNLTYKVHSLTHCDSAKPADCTASVVYKRKVLICNEQS